MDLEKNKQAIRSLLHLMNDYVEKYPELSFLDILYNLGFTNEHIIEETPITIQKLLFSRRLECLYGDTVYKTKEDAKKSFKEHDDKLKNGTN